MASLDEIRDYIAANARDVVDVVLARWDRIIEEEPWWSMGHVDEDRLAPLVGGLADAALAVPVDPATARRFVDLSLSHGRDRREGGLRDTVVHQEFVLLRRVIRDVLEERFGWSSTTYRAATRLDEALSQAEIASLHGYHENELPAEFTEKAPDRLTREWLRRSQGWSDASAA